MPQAGMSDKLARKCVAESHTEVVLTELASTTARAMTSGMFHIPAMFVSDECREVQPLFPMYGVAEKTTELPGKGTCCPATPHAHVSLTSPHTFTTTTR